MPARPRILTRRFSLAGLAILLIASCSPTRLHVRRDGADVKEFFVIVDKIDRLEEVINSNSSTDIGGLTLNLADTRPYAYAEFQLEVRTNAADTWRVVRAPAVDWLSFRIIEDPSEVRLTLTGDAFKDRDDLAVAIVVHADSDVTDNVWYGSLFRPEELVIKTSFLLFSNGPKYRVVLKDNGRPFLDKN